MSLAVLVVGLSACARMLEVGEPPTECDVNAQAGIPCTSVRDMWELTNNTETPTRAQAAELKAERQRSTPSPTAETTAKTAKRTKHIKRGKHHPKRYRRRHKDTPSEVDVAKQARAYPGGTIADRRLLHQSSLNDHLALVAPSPLAVRTPPKVLRILINDWIDKDDVLHMPGYLFVEVEEKKWVTGRGADFAPNRITPLEIRRASKQQKKTLFRPADNSMNVHHRPAYQAPQSQTSPPAHAIMQAPAEETEVEPSSRGGK